MAEPATIAPLKNIRRHPNADRLLLANICGEQIIVGLDAQEGELYCYFNCDLALDDKFCQANDLYPRFDENGKRVGGGFISPKNRRIRTQLFRSEKSYGFAVPLSYLEYTGYDTSKLKEGDQFWELNNCPICYKYITKQTRQAQGRTKNNRRETPTFVRHMDTDQLGYHIGEIPVGSLVTITSKAHGTSQRSGHCSEPTNLPLWKRVVARCFGIPYETEYWTYLCGTRNVILEKSDGDGYYGTNEFRYRMHNKFVGNLRKGEEVFYEIVGWTDGGSPIMPAVSTDKLGKEFVQRYGNTMWYKYACPPGTCDALVYRIAYVSQDGFVIDLPWSMVKRRCQELGVRHAVELCEPFVYDGDPDGLMKTAEELCQGPDPIDQQHIQEGCVVRIDSGRGTKFYKHKSYEFKVLEGIIKDSDVVDIEEVG